MQKSKLNKECYGCGAPVRKNVCAECIDYLEKQPTRFQQFVNNKTYATFLRQTEEGVKLKAMADSIGVSIERIRQIVAKGSRLVRNLRKRSGPTAQPGDPIEALILSVRAENCFINMGCRTVADVVEEMKDRDEMLRFPNFGLKSYAEVRRVLNHQGLGDASASGEAR